MGAIYGFIPFALSLVLVQVKYIPDERELALFQKTESIQGIVVAVILTVVYLRFPELVLCFCLSHINSSRDCRNSIIPQRLIFN